MRKPVSKQSLRRAMERVHAEGHIQWSEPVGTVVDRVWHEMEKSNHGGGRKRPLSRETVRTAPPPDLTPDTGLDG
ncbi:MAG TPA: hypothetical protein VFI91_11375 [Longimicrobiaceae bacterium]|nr:hypothetical protein [Longimicrobiaceae bacterium]